MAGVVQGAFGGAGVIGSGLPAKIGLGGATGTLGWGTWEE